MQWRGESATDDEIRQDTYSRHHHTRSFTCFLLKYAITMLCVDGKTWKLVKCDYFERLRKILKQRSYVWTWWYLCTSRIFLRSFKCLNVYFVIERINQLNGLWSLKFFFYSSLSKSKVTWIRGNMNDFAITRLRKHAWLHRPRMWWDNKPKQFLWLAGFETSRCASQTPAGMHAKLVSN